MLDLSAERSLPPKAPRGILAQALDNLATPMYIKDRQHRWVFANAACGVWLGKAPADLVEQPEATLLPDELATFLYALDEATFAGQGSAQAIALPRDLAIALPPSPFPSLPVPTWLRRTELTADGSALMCFWEVAPHCSLALSTATDGTWDAPWNMPQIHALLANVPAMIYQLVRQVDGTVGFSFVSPGVYEVFGIEAAAIQANATLILEQIHPLDRPQFETTLAAAGNSLEAWRWEGRYYKPDGQLRWLQTAARPHLQADGAVVWDGLLMDITNRKQAEAAAIEQAVMEQALADNESRFRTITATVPGAVIQLRLQNGQVFVDFVSDRIEAITGLSPASILADANTFLDRIHPLDLPRLEDTFRQAAAQKEPWEFEGRIVTLAGEVRWWQMDATPLHSDLGDTVFCGVIMDCTARKTIEEAYRENDRQLRLALNVSGMGVWTWNMATDEMTWTTEPGTLFEASAVSFCDTFEAYLHNVHPSDRPLLTAAASQALENGCDYQLEYRLQLGDGTLRWVGERAGLWRDADGFVLGLMGTVVDITHRKTAEAALRESEERHRTLINNIPGAVYRCQADEGWTLLFQSEAIADITGYPIDHPVYQGNWRLIYPADRDRVEAELSAALTRKQRFAVEYRILHADGSIRWVEDTGQPVADSTGTVQVIDGVLTDITHRKASEVRLQEFAQREALINRISTQIRDSLDLMVILQTTVQAVRSELATDRVVVYHFASDWVGKVIVESVGEGWLSTLGEMGADNCFPKGMASYYAAGRVRAIDDIYTAGLDDCHVKYLEKLQVRANLIVPILLKKELWGLLIAHECRGPRVWTGGELELLSALAGQVGIAIGQADLYQQATANAAQARQQAQSLATALTELQRTQAQLVQTEKMSSLGQLVAGVAHEINNPVGFISGNIDHAWDYTQDLLRLIHAYQSAYPNPPADLAAMIEAVDLDFLMADFPKLLESMRVGAERITNIVTSLRTFSRMDEAEIKAVNLHDGLDSTVMILQHRLKAHGDRPGITLHRHYDDLPPVECYAGQLNQVFMNLISNAIDALEEQLEEGTQSTPPSITLVTQRVSDRQVRITIADNGPGIPEDVRRHIFEPFYTTKPIGKGTGIGLSISYQIVTDRHQGTLECESEPGNGTAFHITIPIQLGLI